jgi:hypothetical protein
MKILYVPNEQVSQTLCVIDVDWISISDSVLSNLEVSVLS